MASYEISPALASANALTPDVEKNAEFDSDVKSVDGSPDRSKGNSGLRNEASRINQLDDGVPRHTGVFKPLWVMAERLNSIGVEARGIERVREEDRFHTSIFDIFTLWWSANMGMTIFGLGVLGTVIWDLSFKESVMVIVVFNVITHFPVAWFNVWGCKTGLRTMALSLFSFGPYTNYIPVIFNLVATVGWSCVNAIGAVSVLRAVSTTHQIPIPAAVVLIAVLTLVPVFFGYNVVHFFNRFSGWPVLVIYLILLGLNARYMEAGTYSTSGSTKIAGLLSFGGTLAGSPFGWASFGADWSVNMRADTNSWKIFTYAYFGLVIPHIFLQVLGAAMMTTFNQRPENALGYASGDIGGLLNAGFSRAGGFGKFLQVLLVLAIVAGNTPNIYSFTMTFQLLGKKAQAVPRPLLVVIMTVIYGVLAGVGANTFSSTLQNLIVFLGYWLSCWCIILIAEHVVFRKMNFANYDLDGFQDRKKLPLGLAALAAVCTGWVGAVMGMSQTWNVGPVAKLIGGGGDIGWILSLSFGFVTYVPARYLERKYWGH